MATSLTELDKLVQERLAKELPEALQQENVQPTSGIDPNRIGLLKYLDSPFLKNDGTPIEIGDTAKALYLITCGPAVLRPLLAGNPAEFEVNALIFFEDQARGSDPRTIMFGVAELIKPTMISQPPPQMPVDVNKKAEIILGTMKDNPELLKSLRKKRKADKKKGK